MRETLFSFNPAKKQAGFLETKNSRQPRQLIPVILFTFSTYFPSRVCLFFRFVCVCFLFNLPGWVWVGGLALVFLAFMFVSVFEFAV